MKDKGIMILTAYSCSLGVVAGFAIADGLHRYAGVDELFFGKDRIQWELLLTSFAAVLVAWRIYAAERNKTKSMARSAVMTARGVINLVIVHAENGSLPPEHIDEIHRTIEFSIGMTENAIIACNDAKLSLALNRVFGWLLNFKYRIETANSGDPIDVEEVVDKLNEAIKSVKAVWF